MKMMEVTVEGGGGWWSGERFRDEGHGAEETWGFGYLGGNGCYHLGRIIAGGPTDMV